MQTRRTASSIRTGVAGIAQVRQWLTKKGMVLIKGKDLVERFSRAWRRPDR